MSEILPIPDDQKNNQEMIREAAIAGALSGSLSLVLAIYSRFSFQDSAAAGLFLLDVIVTWALSFGIYKKSRVCAVVMTVGYAFSKAFSLVRNPAFNILDVVIALGFLYFFIQGIFGTFRFHRQVGKFAKSPGD